MGNRELVRLYYFLSFGLLLCGYGFYLFVRGYDPLFDSIQFPAGQLALILPALLADSFPTFIHVLAFSMFSYAALGARKKFRFVIVLLWCGINVLMELLQIRSSSGINIVPGTYDVADMMAVIPAGVIFYAITSIIDFRQVAGQAKPEKRFRTGLAFPLALTAGMFSIVGSYTEDTFEPVYMSYEELRGPLKMEPDRPLKESGKIYLYQNLLLVSEPNKGIHIYDNTDPSKPIQKVFLNIPGNLDIAVRDGYLYADSFIDIMVIDINDMEKITVTQRIESVFPYNPYQAVPVEKRFFISWDESKGVIIGARGILKDADGLLNKLYEVR